MSPAQNSVLHFYDQMLAAFSRLDLDGFRGFFHIPCLVTTPRSVDALTTEDEFNVYFGAVFASLRERGFTRSKLIESNIAIQSETLAIASVRYIRYKGDDQELEQLGATYTLTKMDGEWRIAAVAAHAADKVLSF